MAVDLRPLAGHLVLLVAVRLTLFCVLSGGFAGFQVISFGQSFLVSFGLYYCSGYARFYRVRREKRTRNKGRQEHTNSERRHATSQLLLATEFASTLHYISDSKRDVSISFLSTCHRSL